MRWCKKSAHFIFICSFLVCIFVFLQGRAYGQPKEKSARSVKELKELLVPVEGCAKCHESHYQQWKSSYHAQALKTMFVIYKKYLDEIGKSKGKVSREDSMGCLKCHAPTFQFATDEAIQEADKMVMEGKTEPLESFGVDCIHCHTYEAVSEPEGNTYYGPIEDPVKTAPHHSSYEPKTVTSEFCQSCHESAKKPEVYCSLAYESWKESQVSKDKQCQYCHMKSRDGVASKEGPTRVLHSHDFAGGHSPAALKDAVSMHLASKVKQDGLIELEIAITNLTGHQIPDT